MKSVPDIAKLGINRDALNRIKDEIGREISIESYTLFGSYSRGEADEESDIDLLILTEKPLTLKERDIITDVVFNVNLIYDTNFSTTTVPINEWENGVISVLSIHDEVERDGIEV